MKQNSRNTHHITRNSNPFLLQGPGFTLIELLVAMTITVMIATISIANFRQGQKQKQVAIAVDVITNAFRNAQNFALTGKKTNNANPACRTPALYYVHFDYSGHLDLYAQTTCPTTDLIESYVLPTNTRIVPGTGILVNGNPPSDAALNLNFLPPFGQMSIVGATTPETAFLTLNVTVELSSGGSPRTLTVDGVAGRIGQ